MSYLTFHATKVALPHHTVQPIVEFFCKKKLIIEFIYFCCFILSLDYLNLTREYQLKII